VPRASVDEWRPAIWLGPGGAVSLRADTMWTVRARPGRRFRRTAAETFTCTSSESGVQWLGGAAAQ
jgi:hypothetical protein